MKKFSLHVVADVFQVDNTVLGGVDWFPTVIALANLTMPTIPNLDGQFPSTLSVPLV